MNRGFCNECLEPLTQKDIDSFYDGDPLSLRCHNCHNEFMKKVCAELEKGMRRTEHI